eukprot:TRINITY_DN18646_c0_g1_i1.p1 TRINITY_DN18646_c0_g1~~TRINITY_DN18646_c0_g1_i1.p1  ORF type:complete len:449 (-),score=149.36 TRINITY_DN18646_c0_g1_i1:909-2255(-)
MFGLNVLARQGLPTAKAASRAFKPLKLMASSPRFLNIHEYQSQQLMKSYGIDIPEGYPVSTPEEAEAIARKLDNGDGVVVKAQVLAGGRGLGEFTNGFKGGVHVCTNGPEQVKQIAGKMLGQTLVTKQTGPEGKVVTKLLVARRHFIRRETYLAMMLDRASQGPVIIASRKGGVDIEKVAHESPEEIVKVPFDINKGPTSEQIAKAAAGLGFTGKTAKEVERQIGCLWKMFQEKDALMIEINPYAEISTGQVMPMDAKLNFDDNAEFRQKDLFALRDVSQMAPAEVQAGKWDLNYIQLDGAIGCLVNGAGLAMATMDLIQINGGKPANFLDVGGGAKKEQVTEAIKIISSDPNVKSILVNIFGGIMRCDVIALGLISAVNELSLKIPLIVRLQGTNVTEARKIIADSGLKILYHDDLDTAARTAVRVAEISRLAADSGVNVNFEIPMI